VVVKESLKTEMFYLKFESFEIDKDFSDNTLKFGTSSDIILQF